MAKRRPSVLPRSLVTVAGCVLLLAACSSSADNGASGPAPTTAADGSSAAASGDYPVTIDNCGRTLTFDKAPTRVVAAYEPTLKVLLDLGVADHVVGTTDFNEGEPELPADEAAARKKIPVISKDITLPPKETLLNLGPDLVYVVQSSEFDSTAGKATQDQLAQIGAQTYIASAWCTPDDVPNATIAETYDDILNMGKIFGVSDRAEQIVARQKAAIADVEAKVAGTKPLRVVAYNEGLGPLSLVGGGLITDVLAKAGAENIFADEDGFFSASVESVAASDPDAFVVFDYPSFDGKSGRTAEEKAQMLFRLLPTTTAAKNKRWIKMYAVEQHPGGFDADSVPRIARELHPEQFSGG